MVLPWQAQNPMKTFLEQVVDEMLSNGIPLTDQALILPSRRAITFFHRALAQRLDKPVMTPQCLTLEDLLHKEQEVGLIDPLKARLILYQAYQEIMEDPEPFELFDSWSSAILKDFNTVDTYLIDAKVLYRDLRSLKEIEEWSFQDDEEGPEQRSFNHFWMKLGELYEKFHALLEEIGMDSSGHALRNLVALGKPILNKKKAVHFAGFNAMSPAETALLDAIHGEGRLTMYWDAAAFYVDDADNPAGMFIRRWQLKPWSQKVLGSWSANQEKKITYSGHPNAISQCRHAGRVLGQFENSGLQTALVLADESLLPSMLESLPDELKAVNVTMGMSIQGHALYQLISHYFMILLDAKRSKELHGAWQIHAKSFQRWSESAVDAGIMNPEEMRSLHAHILGSRIIFIKEDELRAWSNGKVHALLKELESDLHSINRLIDLLQDMPLDHALDQGIRDSVLEIMLSLRETISDFPFVHELEQIWKCLRTSLSQQKISFIGEPLEGVQMMGLLETRALDFKQVILIGVNEGNLPKSKRFDTFLPNDIRRHYKLPTQTEEDAVFAYYFYRLMQHPEQMAITYRSEKDATGGGEMSRYLRQLVLGASKQHGWQAMMVQDAAYTELKQVRGPEVIVQNSPELQTQIQEFFRKGVSVSRLNDYLRCPLDFYFKKLLGLKEKEELEEEVGSSELGDVVHEVLENLYKPYAGQGSLAEVDILKLKKSSREELSKVIVEKGLSAIMESGESALVKEMAKRMLSNFFTKELGRLKKGHLEVKSLEEVLAVEIEIESKAKKLTVRCTAKVDREEVNAQGTMIIYYKTGKVDSTSLKFKEISSEEIFIPSKAKALQLLYYTWIYWKSKKRIAKAGIISMVGKEPEPLSLTIGNESLKEEDLIAFEALLKNKLVEIYELDSFEHDAEHGTYCHYCPEVVELNY